MDEAQVPASSGGDDSPEDAKFFVQRLRELISAPEVPVVNDWSMSVARLISTLDRVPRPAVRALGVLDRFGSVRLTQKSVGFDSDDVPWDSVVRVETAWLLDLVTNESIDREIQRLRKILPRVPGRMWVINRVLGMLRKLVEGSIDRSEDAMPIVSVVTYRSRFGKEKNLSPGLAAAAIMAALPSVNASILASAELRSKPISRPSRRALDENAIRSRFSGLSSRFNGARRDDSGDVE